MGKQQLLIGWASRDVTTNKPVNIPGQFHMRISEGVIDPVTVTALVIESGEDCVIFLSADLCVIRSHLLDEVRAAVKQKNKEIPVEKILMHATHTHTAPGLISEHFFVEEQPPFDGIEVASSDEYRRFLVEQASDAIYEAYVSRKPGGIAYGYGYAVVGHNRRVVYFDDVSKRPDAVVNSTSRVDGHARMYGNTDDPQFSHYEAGADHFVNLLFTFDSQQQLTGAIVNVACPSQNSEHEYRISADFWHDVRTAIRAKYGELFLLPQCAAAGDVSPRILHYNKAQERRFRLKYGDIGTEIAARRDIAERIAQCFDEVYSWAKKEIYTSLPLRHVVETVELSKRLISDEEYAIAKKGLEELEKESFVAEGSPKERLRRNSILVSKRNRYRRIIERYHEQKEQPKLPMELHVVRIGDVAFASNRFELYTDYMHRIQARSPFMQTFVIQLAGQPGPDGGTYLCTARGEEGRGYSASMYCNLVSPKGGQELVDRTVEILKQIHTET
ncbi:MAG: hypothetical protein GX767_06385 [Firmicutes bacterium]|nr:hypothetical protein [Bacillota bacterium]